MTLNIPPTCAIWGGSPYTTSWIGINLLVLSVGLALVALLYSLIRFLPERSKERLNGIVKTELSQIYISALILVVLMGSVQFACIISASLSQSYQQYAKIPGITIGNLDPFTFADLYIGNLASNTGIGLITGLYATSIRYSIESQVMTFAGNFLNEQKFVNDFLKLTFGSTWIKEALNRGIRAPTGVNIVSVDVNPNLDLGMVFKILSEVYLSVFATMVTVATGALLIQFIFLPFMQYTSFSVILPISLMLRSISFSGSGLRLAANSMLALSVAMYLVYPITIAFDSYANAWIFSDSNPAHAYLNNLYTLPTKASFSSAFNPAQVLSSPGDIADLAGNLFGLDFSSALGNLGGLGGAGASLGSSIFISPIEVVSDAQRYVLSIAEFLFNAIVLFALNLAITIGFAMGLAKALNAKVV